MIPADWGETHAPVVRKTLRGTCELREPGTIQDWSEQDKQMVQVPKPPYWSGACRAQELRGEARVITVVGDREVVADYLVVVPLEVAVAETHLVTLTDTGDPALDGLVLQVLQVIRGTERFERDLLCTLTT